MAEVSVRRGSPGLTPNGPHQNAADDRGERPEGRPRAHPERPTMKPLCPHHPRRDTLLSTVPCSVFPPP